MPVHAIAADLLDRLVAVTPRLPGPALPSGTEVWRLDLRQGADLIGRARTLLDSASLARADRYLRPQSTRCHVLTHATLRALLATRLGRDPRALVLHLGPQGKPHLDPADGLHFNLAHSGDLALLALARGAVVGVDVEHASPRRNLTGLAERCFSVAEQAVLAQAPAADRVATFYRLWACKEALVKAWGLGIGAGLDRFDVALDGPDGTHLAAVRAPLVVAGSWHLMELAAPAGYSAALALGQLYDLPTFQ